MEQLAGTISKMVFAVVMLCWLVFAAAFVFRKKPPHAAPRQGIRVSRVGVLLVGVGFALVWSVQRKIYSPILDLGILVHSILACATILISISSVWMILAAVRALGKQWNVTAQLVENHVLITDGPYRYVRNPIYSGMLGMMVSTGLVMCTWYALVLAFLLGWIGTRIRIRSEEQLLHSAFGEEFVLYVQSVPALLPNPFAGKKTSSSN
jgi:protein-S-isoprenylcysteine O-methyltransferase Ste14